MTEPILYVTPEIKEKLEEAYQEEISLRAFQRETRNYIKIREKLNEKWKNKMGVPMFIWDKKKGWRNSVAIIEM